MEVERGKLIFTLSELTTALSKIFILIVATVILILIPWVWITFEGNLNPLTWSGEEWLVVIITSFFAVMTFIAMIVEVLGSQTVKIYENGFYPSHRPLKYGIKGKELFVPWDNIVYMEYVETGEYIGNPSNICRGYRIYYKIDGKIRFQFIGNYQGIKYLGKEYERKVFGKLYEVYTKLKNEGKLLPEKPKGVVELY